MTVRFEGAALEEPQNRDCVEHLCAVLRRELIAYVEAHGGQGDLYPPHSRTAKVTVSGIGAAAAGEATSDFVTHGAGTEGYWHLPHARQAPASDAVEES